MHIIAGKIRNIILSFMTVVFVLIDLLELCDSTVLKQRQLRVTRNVHI